jgi:hypothetical protein
VRIKSGQIIVGEKQSQSAIAPVSVNMNFRVPARGKGTKPMQVHAWFFDEKNESGVKKGPA